MHRTGCSPKDCESNATAVVLNVPDTFSLGFILLTYITHPMALLVSHGVQDCSLAR